MGRNWPPNSFAEWMVGQNFRGQRQASSSTQNPIIRVEISEDEASGDETVAITYPRRRKRTPNQAAAEEEAEPASPEPAPTARKVRFDGEKPLKSALKKTANPDNSDDTLVDTSGTSDDDDATATSTDDASSDANETDTSEDDAPVRRKKGKSKKFKTVVCKKDADSEDSSTDKDVLPHETCECRNCKKGRRIMRAIVEMEVNAKAAKEEAEAKAKEEAEVKAKEEAEAKVKEEAEAKAKEEAEAKAKEEAEAKAKEEAEAKAKEEAEAKAKEEASKKEAKAKEKKEKQKKKDEEKAAEDAEATEAEATEDDKKKQKGKNKKDKEKEKPSPKESEVLAEKILKAVNKAAFKMPKYPKEMEPNLIMPIRSKVMQVEHALEGPNDPQPNAFYDAAKGIARVYHGPQYGNHMAELYGKYNSARMPPGPGTPDQRGFPAGWAGHPAYGPWLFPGPPPGFPGHGGPPGIPFGQVPMMKAQPPRNEAEMKTAAAKGFGLSGQPAPQTPAIVRQFRQEEQEKAASDNASKKNDGNWNSGGGNGWGDNGNTSWGKANSPAANQDPPADASQGQGWEGNANGWDSGSKQGGDNGNSGWGKPNDPAANQDPPADASQGQGWGGGNGGWNSGAKPPGVSSPMNFTSWSNENGNKFERQSNKSGSQKGGSQRNWHSGKPDSQPSGSKHDQSAKGSPNKPADGSQGGGGDQWGQNDTQNVGWGGGNQNDNSWGGGNQNNDSWGQGNNLNNNSWGQGNDGSGWGAAGANGEQGQPSNPSHHTSSPKPPADTGNGPQADTGGNGGGTGWGQTDGWGAPAGGAPGGSKKNTPPKQQQQDWWGAPGNQEQNVWANTGNQPWGGPPGSKPASQRHSSPRNNMNGGNGWQNMNTWDNNGKDPSPSQMPGSWNQGGSRRVSPNEKAVGAFDWPAGQGHPINAGSWQTTQGPPAACGPPQGGGWNGSQKYTGGWDKPSYPSNQATGPSNSWANPEVAQHTGGAADNW